jgi:CubicO group peptidase (beta-lactamase class C family)
MSKSFTAMAILQLRDKGLLQLDDPVGKYVPEIKHIVPLTADCPPLTVRHLLTMQGGLPQDDPWGDRLLDMSDVAFTELLTSGLNPSTPTGTTYEYSNLGYAILGLLIKNITSMSYQQYITNHIFLPLGMKDTVFECDQAGENLVQGYRWEDGVWKEEEMLHDNGYFGAMGGIITTLDDFVRYMSLHQAAWPPCSEPEGTLNASSSVLCRASLREMHYPSSFDGIFHGKNTTPSPPSLPASASTCEVPAPGPVSRSGSGPTPLAGVWAEAYGYGLKHCKDARGVRWIRHAGGLPGE